MKKNSKKGFFLSEVIVVIAVVAVVLMEVFVVFSSVYNSYKSTEKYNTANAMSAATNIKGYFDSVADIDTSSLSNTMPYTDLTDSSVYQSSFYTKLKDEFGVNSVYLLNTNYMNDNNLNNAYVSLRKYMKSLKKQNGILLIVVMNDNEFGYIKLSANQNNARECTYEGELIQGATYIGGQYTYKYMQRYSATEGDWIDIDLVGWGVSLTDKESVSPAVSPICSSISGAPIITTQGMYNGSNASKIDVSSFDTTNVVNMSAMFMKTATTEIIGLENLNTSSVVNMECMFCYNTTLKNLNLSNFDTSNVTNMQSMFGHINVPILDLSSFDTSNVNNTTSMFEARAKTRAYTKSTTELYAFDTSSNKPSTLTFAVKLPSEYQPIEYIQSTGTQYINSKHRTGPNTGIKTTFQFTSTTRQQRLYGNDHDSSSFLLSYSMYLNGSDKWAYAFKNGAGNWASTDIATNTNKHTWTFNVTLGSYTMDSTTKSIASTTRTNTANCDMAILADSRGTDGVSLYASAKLYSFLIYESGSVVKDFVPCYRKSDGVAGLYELKTKEFYTNAGTGEFTKGPAM